MRRANKYIDETMPWVLAKDEAQKPRLDNVLHNLAESIRIISVLHPPVHAHDCGRDQEAAGSVVC